MKVYTNIHILMLHTRVLMSIVHMFQDCYNVIDVQEALRVANGINAIANLINPERFISMSTSAVAQAGVAALKESQLLACQVCVYACVRISMSTCAVAQAGVAALKESQLLACQVCVYACVRMCSCCLWL